MEANQFVKSSDNEKENLNSFTLNSKPPIAYIKFILFETLFFLIALVTCYVIFKKEQNNYPLYLIVILFWLMITLYSFYANHSIRLKYEYDQKIATNSKYEFIKATIFDIDKTIYKYNIVGIVALSITIAAMALLSYIVFQLFEGAFSQIKQFAAIGEKTSTIVLGIIIIILRTSLLGTIIITFLIHSFKFTNASFDQATRFTKRKHASLFLLEVVSHFEDLKPDNLHHIMAAFKEWNVNVESAYTDNSFNTKLAMKIFQKMDKSDENITKLFSTLSNNQKTTTK